MSIIPAEGSSGWLESLIVQKCGVPSVRDFQLCHGMDLIRGKDLFLVIAPGQGKTTVMHAPLLAAQAQMKIGIALMIVPTKLLALQQETVANSRGIRALAINEDTMREAYHNNRDLLAELVSGEDIRLAIMSPQMLRSKRVRSLLSQQAVKSLVCWFFVDEAHLVDEQSGEWIEIFKSIKTMRAILSARTVWAAFTGMATPSRTLVLAENLGFQPGHYVNARYSVDCSNIKYIPRFFEHAVSGTDFLDISFLIPLEMASPTDITTTLIFCQTIELGYKIMSFLDRLIPEAVPYRNKIIKLYNSLMPATYRQHFVQDRLSGAELHM
ncbi:P-loop containing nucleoside triphosphate hydrolase protein [Sparassis crispa]|uniref:DNA 3'-5' helicase n=1 Tax=Sparassis crispa TaxID=139825 RepID=A0A401G9M9_9APHY|nr:P-loop containing nucleoside triphosphate hydrolase protein [Sparassis crispa]GBE78861.1 P-loop containing nucleoside triphosphate hydrolase protein [Sparassis crispa]